MKLLLLFLLAFVLCATPGLTKQPQDKKDPKALPNPADEIKKRDLDKKSRLPKHKSHSKGEINEDPDGGTSECTCTCEDPDGGGSLSEDPDGGTSERIKEWPCGCEGDPDGGGSGCVNIKRVKRKGSRPGGDDKYKPPVPKACKGLKDQKLKDCIKSEGAKKREKRRKMQQEIDKARRTQKKSPAPKDEKGNDQHEDPPAKPDKNQSKGSQVE